MPKSTLTNHRNAVNFLTFSRLYRRRASRKNTVQLVSPAWRLEMLNFGWRHEITLLFHGRRKTLASTVASTTHSVWLPKRRCVKYDLLRGHQYLGKRSEESMCQRSIIIISLCWNFGWCHRASGEIQPSTASDSEATRSLAMVI